MPRELAAVEHAVCNKRVAAVVHHQREFFGMAGPSGTSQNGNQYGHQALFADDLRASRADDLRASATTDNPGAGGAVCRRGMPSTGSLASGGSEAVHRTRPRLGALALANL